MDLDGTLAQYDKWIGIEHIGAPVPAMLYRVKAWLAEGRDVRIFTARVANGTPACQRVMHWCIEHLGHALPITNVKDMHMVELWDDRAIQVEKNTGRAVADERDAAVAQVQKLNDENQELYEKLARAQSLVTELEATIEGLRDQLEEAKCR